MTWTIVGADSTGCWFTIRNDVGVTITVQVINASLLSTPDVIASITAAITSYQKQQQGSIKIGQTITV